MEEKMKLIKKNCVIIAIVGIIIVCVGIGFLSSDGGGSSWGGGWYSSIKKQQEQDQQVGAICLLIGIGVFIFDAVYYNHAKANLSNNKTESDVKPNTTNNTNTDNAAKLRQLKEMCDDDLINKEEYEEKKKRILNNM